VLPPLGSPMIPEQRITAREVVHGVDADAVELGKARIPPELLKDRDSFADLFTAKQAAHLIGLLLEVDAISVGRLLRQTEQWREYEGSFHQDILTCSANRKPCSLLDVTQVIVLAAGAGHGTGAGPDIRVAGTSSMTQSISGL
jgi:hypothetical protein